MSKSKKILLIAPLAIAGLVLFAWIGGQIVMHLWNWLLPDLFGWKTLTFWQALGLLVLCRILFGGFGRGGGGGDRHRSRMHRRMAERWERMTPEEREKWRQSFRGRFSSWQPPDANPTP
jgi:hypothetical protein